MRRYSFKFRDAITPWQRDAEMDTIKEGVVILSKKKEFTGPIVRTDEKPEIVAVVSLANLEFYTYKELENG